VTLTVTKNGTGTGTVSSSPAGIACGTDCTQTAAVGSQFTLSATPATGSTFTGWSGACTGTGTCTVTLSAARTATATFNAVTTPPAGSPAPAGLVAAYTFNETSGSTVTDASGNNNTGTFGSGVTRTAQGRFGSALSFNGGMIRIPHSSSLNLTSAMTLEAWVFPTAPLDDWSTVLMKQMPGDSPYLIYAGTPYNAALVYVTPRGTASGRALTPSTLPLNTWTHLAGTFDGTTLRLYVNGTQVATRTLSGTIVTSTDILAIGGNTIWGEYFQGRIDEVRIYNRALSPAQIQTDMNSPIGGGASAVAQ
jgi:hypothetical protein